MKNNRNDNNDNQIITKNDKNTPINIFKIISLENKEENNGSKD